MLNIYKIKLTFEEAANEQIKLAHELNNIDKGRKPVEKRSFPNNLRLFLGARGNILNNFKRKIFQLKKLNKIPTPEPAPMQTCELAPAPRLLPAYEAAPISKPTKIKISKLKLRKKMEDEIKTDKKDINDEIFWNYFKYKSALYLVKCFLKTKQDNNDQSLKDISNSLIDLRNTV